jgi:regulator of sigma E protease
VVLWANIQQTVTLLIILSILVVAHEWGHFIVARMCGIRVDDFSIGFGKRLFRIGKRGDTEYNVRMLPLGGFVKIAGMEPDEAPLVSAKDKVLGRDAQNDPDAGEIPLLAENIGEHMPYTGPDGFYSKPLWQRSLVILAGPVMSLLFGYVVFCLMGVTTGIPSGKVLTRISLVEPGGEGHRIGLHAGDTIMAINGQPVLDGQQMIAKINASLGQPVTLTVQRDGTTFTRTATPQPAVHDGKPVIYTSVIQPGKFGKSIGLQAGDTIREIADTPIDSNSAALSALRDNAGKPVDIVVTRPTSDDPVTLHGTVPQAVSAAALPSLNSHPIGVLKIDPSAEFKRLSFVQSIKAGTAATGFFFSSLAAMVHQPSQIKDNAGGIIYMYQMTGVVAKNGLADKINLMAGLSISLAVFNLLPIPVLDGGHLLTFFIEWVRRGKRLTEQQQQAFLMTGLTIIGVLFVLVMSNDILRTVRHQLPQ